MRTHVTDGSEAPDHGATSAIPRRAIAIVGRSSLPMPMMPVGASRCYLRQDIFLNRISLQRSKAVFGKPSLLTKQLAVATALALGASSAAFADDSSMSPFTGDSYKYFNGGHSRGDPGHFTGQVFSRVPADPSWRQSHPNGLTERELQALSSSDLSVFASQLNRPVFASAPADPSWRQSHPNGLTENELLALSSSSASRWRLPNGSGYVEPGNQANLAQSPSSETFSARLARFFHPASGAQAGTNE
jgi:hypothetical protein